MYDLGPADTGSLCKSATSGKPKDSGEPAHVILQDQGRSARIVTAEGATCFAIICDRGVSGAWTLVGCRYPQIQNGLPALTFHNSRSDSTIDSRFDQKIESTVARMKRSAIRGMGCRWSPSHE